MGSGHHLSLSLSREMWNQILAAALPFSVVEGEIELARTARNAVRQLPVQERVVGLLEDKRTPQPLVRMSERARDLWRSRRGDVYERLAGLVTIEGTWRVDVDDFGTNLAYGQQKVAADAYLKGTAEGTITFLRENVVIPFRIEKRVGASLALGRIRYSRERDAVIGNIQDLAVHLGDNTVLQLLSRVVEYGVEQRIGGVEPVPVLKRDQVEQLVGGLGGAMRLAMGVDDLQLDITEDDMTLKVRFGFSSLPSDRQLETD